jgi:hypothetical protein
MLFRIKSDLELAMSGTNECRIAKCQNSFTRAYDNEINIIKICDYHYTKLCEMRYGE